ncbi:MAG: hypothetical protein SFZ03_04230 [Candidatus Melainabacteria bacterium]|nr:hypothetical protein [Candidatus Melainabacteria bacterium]
MMLLTEYNARPVSAGLTATASPTPIRLTQNPFLAQPLAAGVLNPSVMAVSYPGDASAHCSSKRPRQDLDMERLTAGVANRAANGAAKATPWNASRLAVAALLVLTGMLTHQLPAIAPKVGKTWMPVDWKPYARIGLGIAAVHELNQALGWKPPPWLGALEAVGVINPLALGLSVGTVAQGVVMAPLVAGTVQLSQKLCQALDHRLEGRNVPPWVPRLGVSLGLSAVGMAVYPKLFGAFKKMLPEVIQAEINRGRAAAGVVMATCPRGCSPGSIVCLSEMAEIFGGMLSWLREHLGLALPQTLPAIPLSATTRAPDDHSTPPLRRTFA